MVVEHVVHQMLAGSQAATEVTVRGDTGTFKAERSLIADEDVTHDRAIKKVGAISITLALHFNRDRRKLFVDEVVQLALAERRPFNLPCSQIEYTSGLGLADGMPAPVQGCGGCTAAL